MAPAARNAEGGATEPAAGGRKAAGWARPREDGRSVLQAYIDGLKALAPGHRHTHGKGTGGSGETSTGNVREGGHSLGLRSPVVKNVWARATARGRKIHWAGGLGFRNKVLVPTDGSVYSEAAVKWACESTRLEADDELALVMCVERMGAVRPASSPTGEDVFPLTGFIARSIEFQAEKDQARALLKKDAEVANNTLRLRRGPGHGVSITTEVLLSPGGEGNKGVGKALCAHAVKVGATQVVMGSHGHGTAMRVLLSSVGLGSVSHWVVHHSPVPVVVVRNTGEPAK